MRLYEIISSDEITTRTGSNFDFDAAGELRSIAKDKAAYGEPGYGSYAYGQDDEDEHLYNKIHYYPSRLKVDAYYQWVQAIKPYMDSNPYLPRVYVTELQKDNQGKIRPIYKMEKLMQPTEFSAESLMGMADKMFKYLDQYFENYTSVNSSPRSVFDAIVDIIKEIMTTGAYDIIKDPLLDQAIELVDIVKNQNENFKYDIHRGNFMVRGTSIGPQLVFTDPLWEKNRGSQQLSEKK